MGGLTILRTILGFTGNLYKGSQRLSRGSVFPGSGFVVLGFRVYGSQGVGYVEVPKLGPRIRIMCSMLGSVLGPPLCGNTCIRTRSNLHG